MDDKRRGQFKDRTGEVHRRERPDGESVWTATRVTNRRARTGSVYWYYRHDCGAEEMHLPSQMHQQTPQWCGSCRPSNATQHTGSRTYSVRKLVAKDPLTSIAFLDFVVERPITRADCEHGERPCPFASCRHHLYLDVSERTGSIKMNFPETEVEDMKHSCSLDLADAGGMRLEQVGEALNLTRERVRQIEEFALRKIKADARLRELMRPE